MPENPASYRVVRTKSYLFNKALRHRRLPDQTDRDKDTYLLTPGYQNCDSTFFPSSSYYTYLIYLPFSLTD
ncbi:hypothetical protein C2U55_25450 [Enterobacteriaceae bacterium ENNIH3]|nr:hypothetical protein C2U55_25450 [Enterobacteriaceae bacterium ENNIH3]AUV07781.1 hypothetical protein C2U52_16660 [Enterobacteriaceae bacterium ENNIH2]